MKKYRAKVTQVPCEAGEVDFCEEIEANTLEEFILHLTLYEANDGTSYATQIDMWMDQKKVGKWAEEIDPETKKSYWNFYAPVKPRARRQRKEADLS